jgi:hypothetical protein
MSADNSALFIQKQAGTFYITEIMWLGQVGLKFQLHYFALVS